MDSKANNTNNHVRSPYFYKIISVQQKTVAAMRPFVSDDIHFLSGRIIPNQTHATLIAASFSGVSSDAQDSLAFR